MKHCSLVNICRNTVFSTSKSRVASTQPHFLFHFGDILTKAKLITLYATLATFRNASKIIPRENISSRNQSLDLLKLNMRQKEKNTSNFLFFTKTFHYIYIHRHHSQATIFMFQYLQCFHAPIPLASDERCSYQERSNTITITMTISLKTMARKIRSSSNEPAKTASKWSQADTKVNIFSNKKVESTQRKRLFRKGFQISDNNK